MAILYLWSGSAQDDSDSTWNSSTVAYTSLNAVLTAWTTTDVIYVHAGATTPHNESAAGIDLDTPLAGKTTVASPCEIYAVDKDNGDAEITDPTTPGAPLFEVTGNNSEFDFGNEIISLFNCWLRSSNHFNCRTSALLRFVNCFSEIGYGQPGGTIKFDRGAEYVVEDGTMTFGDNSGEGTVSFPNSAAFRVRGAKIIVYNLDNGDFGLVLGGVAGRASIIEFVGVDFSESTDTDFDYIFADPGQSPADFRAEQCVLSSGLGLVANGNAFAILRMSNCDESGGDQFRTEINFRGAGTCRTESGVTRSGGWSDKTDGGAGTPVSHAYIPTADASPSRPLMGIPLVSFIDSTGSKTFETELLLGDGAGGTSKKLSKTVTVNQIGYYMVIPGLVVDDLSSPTDHDIWLDVYFLGTSGETLWHSERTQDGYIVGGGGTLTAGGGGWTGTTTNNVLYIDPAVTVTT